MPYKSHTLPNTCLCTFVVTILFELPHSFPYQFSLSSCRGWDTHSLIAPYPMIRPSILYPYPIFDGLGQHIMNHIKLCNRKQANKSRWVSLGMTYSLVTDQIIVSYPSYYSYPFFIGAIGCDLILSNLVVVLILLFSVRSCCDDLRTTYCSL